MVETLPTKHHKAAIITWMDYVGVWEGADCTQKSYIISTRGPPKNNDKSIIHPSPLSHAPPPKKNTIHSTWFVYAQGNWMVSSFHMRNGPSTNALGPVSHPKRSPMGDEVCGGWVWTARTVIGYGVSMLCSCCRLADDDSHDCPHVRAQTMVETSSPTQPNQPNQTNQSNQPNQSSQARSRLSHQTSNIKHQTSNAPGQIHLERDSRWMTRPSVSIESSDGGRPSRPGMASSLLGLGWFWWVGVLLGWGVDWFGLVWFGSVQLVVCVLPSGC
jgi:hypothetical protein